MELGNVIARNTENSFSVPVQVMDNNASAISGENFCDSRDGFLLTEALRTAQQTPDVRENKVEALKARIAAGEYEVDPVALARALVLEDGGIFRV